MGSGAPGEESPVLPGSSGEESVRLPRGPHEGKWRPLALGLAVPRHPRVQLEVSQPRLLWDSVALQACSVLHPKREPKLPRVTKARPASGRVWPLVFAAPRGLFLVKEAPTYVDAVALARGREGPGTYVITSLQSPELLVNTSRCHRNWVSGGLRAPEEGPLLTPWGEHTDGDPIRGVSGAPGLASSGLSLGAVDSSSRVLCPLLFFLFFFFMFIYLF